MRGGRHGATRAEEERGRDFADVPIAEGDQGEEGGDGPESSPADDAGFEVLVFLHAGGDKGVDSREGNADSGAEEERREIGGVKEPDPELMDVQPAARCEHEGDDAVDDDEAGEGAPEVNPSVPLVELGA